MKQGCGKAADQYPDLESLPRLFLLMLELIGRHVIGLCRFPPTALEYFYDNGNLRNYTNSSCVLEFTQLVRPMIELITAPFAVFSFHSSKQLDSSSPVAP